MDKMWINTHEKGNKKKYKNEIFKNEEELKVNKNNRN